VEQQPRIARFSDRAPDPPISETMVRGSRAGARTFLVSTSIPFIDPEPEGHVAR
jgi:hypothetical protein